MQPTMEQKLRMLLVLHAALMMGVVLFTIVVLVLNRPSAGQSANVLLAMRVACVAVLSGAVVLATVLRRAAVNRCASGSGEPTEDELMAAFAALSIARAAVAEGGALLAIVLFMLSANAADLALIGGGIIVLAAMIPLRSKWESFIEAVQAQRGRQT